MYLLQRLGPIHDRAIVSCLGAEHGHGGGWNRILMRKRGSMSSTSYAMQIGLFASVELSKGGRFMC
jgi:hypothetical protein